MPLPEIELDDRRFQDLVNEARLRIHRACPEWTEHNVSDPGITLIELFAWMTEMTHLPAQPRAGQAARRAAGPARDPARRPERATASCASGSRRRRGADRRSPAATPRSARCAPRTTSRSSSRSTRTSRSRRPGRSPTSSSAAARPSDVGVADGTRARQGADQLAFGEPAAGRRRALPRLRRAARAAARCGSTSRPRRRAARASTPRTRRCAGRSPGGDGDWLDGRGPRGPHRRLQLRLGHRRAPAARRAARSSRVAGTAPALAALPDRTTRRAAGRGDRPTRTRRRSTSITAAPIGALLAAAHSARVERESRRRLATARPARSSRCATRPCSSRRPARRSRSRTPSPATGSAGSCASTSSARRVRPPLRPRPRRRARSSSAPRSARPTAAGRSTAPCRRRARSLRFTRYRHGGGRDGNVAAERAHVLTSPIPGVDTVTNPEPARRRRRRRDARARARQRAAMEIRSRYRAVTAEDFEFLAGEASPRVARAVCIPPPDGGAVPLHIVPARLPAGPPAHPTTS